MTDGQSDRPMRLDWVFGCNSHILSGVHSLMGSGAAELFYTAGHLGVIYNVDEQRQEHLQGHSNAITACCCSTDKRWLVTADAGPDCLIVIWEAATRTPVRTIVQPHEHGVAALAISADATRLASISSPSSDRDGAPQELCIWDWTDASTPGPATRATLPTPDRVRHVVFHPEDARQLVTTGAERVVFWGVGEAAASLAAAAEAESKGDGSAAASPALELSFFAPPVMRRQLDRNVAPFTGTIFVPGTASALSSTTDGCMLLWDTPPSAASEGRLLEKVALKVIQAGRPGGEEEGDEQAGSAITWLGVVPGVAGDKPDGEPATTPSGPFVVVGSADGAVRVFDSGVRLLAWYEDIMAGPVTSVSFHGAATAAVPSARLAAAGALPIPDFLVGTSRGLVVHMAAHCFAEVDPTARQGELLLQAADESVTCLATHPGAPRAVWATRGGAVQLWETSSREMVSTRLLAEEERAERDRLRRLGRNVQAAPDAGGDPLLGRDGLPARKVSSGRHAVTAAAWHPSGVALALAVGGGAAGATARPRFPAAASLRIVDAETLEDLQPPLGTLPQLEVSVSGGDANGPGASGAGGSAGAGGGRRRPQLQRTEGPGGKVTHLRFSKDGAWLAAADDARYVSLWHFARTLVPARPDRKEWQLLDGEDEEMVEEERWVFVGRARTHSAPVTGLEWCVDPASGRPRLVTVGADRRAVEYDAEGSSAEAGLIVKMPRVRVEQTAVPTCCAWLPPGTLPGVRELLLATATDSFKLKLLTDANKTCRRTALAPTFGGPLTSLVVLPEEGPAGAEATDGAPHSALGTVAAYSTARRVAGLVLLPVDGNPNRAIGVLAHAGEIREIAPVVGGGPGGAGSLLTVGGADGTAALWTVDRSAMRQVATAGGEGLAPYLALLPGGVSGAFFQQICDLFAYAQIRSQGEDSTQPRRSGNLLPLRELPSLMRALGFYPTEAEATSLCDEVRYGSFASGGKRVEEVSLEDVVKLFINHRPVMGVGRAAVQDALRVIRGKHDFDDTADTTPYASVADRPTGGGEPGPTRAADGVVDWQRLRESLQQAAERMGDRELRSCLESMGVEEADLAARGTLDTEGVIGELLGLVAASD